MTLTVEGFLYRTSGSAAPFNPFDIVIKDPSSALGVNNALPGPDGGFIIDEVKDDGLVLSIFFGDKKERFDLKMGDYEFFKAEKAIVAIEATISLKE